MLLQFVQGTLCTKNYYDPANSSQARVAQSQKSTKNHTKFRHYFGLFWAIAPAMVGVKQKFNHSGIPWTIVLLTQLTQLDDFIS